MNNILTRFGVPEKLVNDNAMCFRSKEFVDLYKKYGISFSYSSPYHPQGNGEFESNNKSLIKIIKRVIEKNKRAWDSKLKQAL